VIAGMPRSGTTLLRRLCDGHPRMRVTNELGNFGFVGDPYLLYALRAAKRVIEINGRSRISGRYGSRRANNVGNLSFVTAHLLRLARVGLGRVTLRTIVDDAGRTAPEALVVGDKMPQYIFGMDRLVRFAGLRRLVIYRDCRDVTSSFLTMVRTTWRHRLWVRRMRTAAEIAGVWVQAMEITERHAEHLFAVRYEDLVRDPDLELRRLAEWLGVEAAGFDRTIVSASSIGQHRGGLSSRELADVLRVAGPTLRRWGYAPDPTDPEPGINFS
jgi:hypothetical protein